MTLPPLPPEPPSRVRRHDRVDDRKDASRIFRYTLAAGAVLAGLLWPFVESYRGHSLDSETKYLWGFCAVVLTMACYPETRGYLSDLAKVVRRRNGKSDDTDEHQTGD